MRAAVRAHIGDLVRAMGGCGVTRTLGREGILNKDDPDVVMPEI